MRFLIFLLASTAFAQSELGTSAIRMIPRQADTDTGVIRWYEITGGNRVDLRAPQSIVTDQLLRIPNETGVLIADTNRMFGTDVFTITAITAAGTEASPSNISNGRDLFKFAGYARTGGTSVQAARLLFTADTASPLQTNATIGLTNSGTFKANSYAFEYSKFWPAEGQRPDLGTSAATGRWGTLYGDSLDLLVPTGSSPAYETGSFIRAQSLELYDSTGYSGGFKHQVVNVTGGASYLEILDASASPVWRFNRVASGSPVTIVDSYMSIVPATTTTYNLGDTSHRWDRVWANRLDLGTGGFTSNASPYVTNSVDLGTSLLEWDTLYVHDIQLSGTCTGCPSGSGSAPLDEAKITDYGADDTCSTAINTAYASAKAALTKGGRITFPPGCYLINASLTIGNSAGTSESTEEAIYLRGAGAAYNPSGLASNTEIRWDSGTVPGSATPMVQFSGPINAGGIEGILLNAAATANVYYVNQRHHGYGTFRNVWAKRSPVSPSWIVTTSSTTYPYGSCYNRYDQFHLTNDSVSGGGGMYLTGATGSGRDACSNLFTDGEIWYDSDTAGTYGVKLDYADNNTFLRFNLFRTSNGPGALESSYSSGSAWAVSCNTSTEYCTLGASNSAIANGARVRFSYGPSGSLPTGIQWALPYFVINKSGNTFQVSLTSGGSAVDITAAGSNVIVFLVNPGVLLERYSGDDSFPKENAWYSSAIHNGVWSPNPPTGGNDFPEFQPDDCYVSPCIPDLDYVWGKAKGQMLGSGATPPGVEVQHTDAQNTFRLNQASGLQNGAGSIAFQRAGTTLGRIRASYFDGMTFSMAPVGGSDTDRWKISAGYTGRSAAGDLEPATDASQSIGSVSIKPNQIWARGFRSYTNNAFGAQSHILYADHNVNLDLKSYGSAGNDYRPGINFYRSEGTAASPSPIAANDRLGLMAFWYNVGSGSESMTVGGRIQMIADAYSGSAATTSLRFHTSNAGTEALRWKITGAGNLNPGSTGYYIGGAPGSGESPVGRVHADDFAIQSSTGAVYPPASGQGYVGLSGFRFYYGYIDNIISRTSVVVQNATSEKFEVSPTSLTMVDSTNNAVFNVSSGGTTTIKNLTIFGTSITAPDGNAGFDTSGYLVCASGNAIKAIRVSKGIITDISCGIP